MHRAGDGEGVGVEVQRGREAAAGFADGVGVLGVGEAYRADLQGREAVDQGVVVELRDMEDRGHAESVEHAWRTDCEEGLGWPEGGGVEFVL